MVTMDVYCDSFAIVAKYKTLERIAAANKMKQYHSLYSQVKQLLAMAIQPANRKAPFN